MEAIVRNQLQILAKERAERYKEEGDALFVWKIKLFSLGSPLIMHKVEKLSRAEPTKPRRKSNATPSASSDQKVDNRRRVRKDRATQQLQHAAMSANEVGRLMYCPCQWPYIDVKTTGSLQEATNGINQECQVRAVRQFKGSHFRCMYTEYLQQQQSEEATNVMHEESCQDILFLCHG